MAGGRRVWCECRPRGKYSEPDPECDICEGYFGRIWECAICGWFHEYPPFECHKRRR